MLIDSIKKIRSNSIEIIEKDKTLTLLVFQTYADVFAGGRVSQCGTCLRTLYSKICSIDLVKFEKMAKKTCVMIPGLVHVHAKGKHYSDAGMSDELATELLNQGYLTERHFKALPKGYKKAEVKEEKKDVKIELNVSNKGKFAKENLMALNGEQVMSFAQKLEKDSPKPKSKVAAIDSILKWQKAE